MSWFIPPEFDDGFTVTVDGFSTRPMLYRQRSSYLAVVNKYQRAMLGRVLVRPWLVDSEDCPQAVDESVLAAVVQRIVSYSSAQEAADYCELRDGFSLFFEHPGMACMSCKVCHEIIVDIDKGVPHIPTGGSEPVYRPPGINVPCDAGRTCPKGHWSKPKGFSKLCEQVWRHYWMMKAAGKPAPDCPIIHRNWALIDWIIGGKRANLNPMAAGST